MRFKNSKFAPDFIGIGMRKCGTTWLAEMLKAHPEVGFSREKEVSFFNNIWALVEKPQKSKLETEGIESYEKYFNKGRVIGEWSVTYAADPNVAERIKHYFPDVKILVSLRNPVERAVSFYNHAKNVRLIDESKNFEEAIKKHTDYIGGGMYYPQLKLYFDLFPKEQIKIILLDDIEKDSRAVVRDLYNFLGVDSSFVPEGINEKTNVSRKVRYKFFYKLVVTILLHFKNLVPKNARPYARIFGKKKILSSIDRHTSQPFESPPLKEKTRRHLLEVFKPDIERTAKLIDRDLSAWYV